MKGQQLALSVALGESASFGSYHAGPNTAAVNTLRELLAPGGGMTLLLHGPSGSGKSHLAHALQASAAERGLSCSLIDLGSGKAFSPGALEGLERKKLVILDALDHSPLSDDFELALVRLLDAVKARGGSLLLTARKSAAQLSCTRPDLLTRISGAASYGLKPLSDEDRARLLTIHAHERGLHLPEEVAHYLLRHLPRDVGSLMNAVQVLDGASLAQQRRLTIPFVQSILLRS